ncbi:superoxide dismutase family protein [Cereibacter sphaeroides]|uniref:superoxide dismutase family protein n=1 Tax=Cereibacter sphaeroides TaxID=1063 RepID=UPI001F18700C|nr:superoxide dismutase family protein [Cereibacter sphaeroides]MCE6959016.1 superoxide dismutase family protein [Cereibacter sphaeroides]MCE6969080.1 superoxide dismutase family protein [Cereibacter sphaeroides]MCE6973642.1 superoxide dismutase family protein [Cereibacter sphaeroides]
MKRMIAPALAAQILAATALPLAAQETQSQQTQGAAAGFAERTATFIDTGGTAIGTARIAPLPHGVLITLDLQGLPADSWLGFHIHQNGECDPAGGFESAGGHFDISQTQHGLMIEDGPHAGDMPNQHVGADGILRAQVFNTFVQLSGENASDLTGRALVLHAGPDDYESQPSGKSGDRIACAVIE